MPHLNVEIKARTRNMDHIRAVLAREGASFRGQDQQTDTYFLCPQGRLKLRQGTIETNLIFYQRSDLAGPKASQVHLYAPADHYALHALLSAALGVWKVVRKKRAIYFLDNVKVHLDKVEGLGEFVEIEAIDEMGTIGEERLRAQCAHYLGAFRIRPEDLLTGSYSDMLGSDVSGL